MRLAWRDAVATVFAGLVVVVVLAVTGSWGWPLLGSYKAGIVALVLLAVPMCLVGGYAFWDSVAFRHPVQAFHDPYLALGMALGPAAIVLVIGGLISGTEAWFLAGPDDRGEMAHRDDAARRGVGAEARASRLGCPLRPNARATGPPTLEAWGERSRSSTGTSWGRPSPRATGWWSGGGGNRRSAPSRT